MRVYLDHHSTTPCDERVVEAMKPFWTERFGNPSAVHEVGNDAREAVEQAREQVAAVINAPTDAICFTSGATEANNIVLQGLMAKCTSPRKIITTNVEHSSVLKTVDRINQDGAHGVILLQVDGQGLLSLTALNDILASDDTIGIVSVMAANNEIGTIYNIEKIGEICKRNNVFFHTDATQAIGKVDIDVQRMNIDALSMSAHKIYGPKGIGALYIKDKSRVKPIICGGFQEEVTSGTSNVPAIVGFGEACRLLIEESPAEREQIGRLRDRLLKSLTDNLDDIKINGTMENRLPNNLNLTIKGVQAEALVLGMDDVIVSSGSACISQNPEPSHVIRALGVDNADCAIRIGIGKGNTEEEIDYASARIIEVVNAVRSG